MFLSVSRECLFDQKAKNLVVSLYQSYVSWIPSGQVPGKKFIIFGKLTYNKDKLLTCTIMPPKGSRFIWELIAGEEHHHFDHYCIVLKTENNFHAAL